MQAPGGRSEWERKRRDWERRVRCERRGPVSRVASGRPRRSVQSAWPLGRAASRAPRTPRPHRPSQGVVGWTGALRARRDAGIGGRRSWEMNSGADSGPGPQEPLENVGEGGEAGLGTKAAAVRKGV